MLVVLVDQKKEKKKSVAMTGKRANKERTRRMDCRKVASPLCHEKDGGMGRKHFYRSVKRISIAEIEGCRKGNERAEGGKKI